MCAPPHLSAPPRPTPPRPPPSPCSATGRPAEAQQENTEATDADLLRKANPFLAKLLSTHLAGDKEAQGIAGAAGEGGMGELWACGCGACCGVTRCRINWARPHSSLIPSTLLICSSSHHLQTTLRTM